MRPPVRAAGERGDQRAPYLPGAHTICCFNTCEAFVALPVSKGSRAYGTSPLVAFDAKEGPFHNERKPRRS